MNNSNILISLSTYKKAENIVKITEKIKFNFLLKFLLLTINQMIIQRN